MPSARARTIAPDRPLTVPEGTLLTMQFDLTYLGGKLVYRRNGASM
jgi:hypothetical protein